MSQDISVEALNFRISITLEERKHHQFVRRRRLVIIVTTITNGRSANQGLETTHEMNVAEQP